MEKKSLSSSHISDNIIFDKQHKISTNQLILITWIGIFSAGIFSPLALLIWIVDRKRFSDFDKPIYVKIHLGLSIFGCVILLALLIFVSLISITFLKL